MNKLKKISLLTLHTSLCQTLPKATRSCPFEGLHTEGLPKGSRWLLIREEKGSPWSAGKQKTKNNNNNNLLGGIVNAFEIYSSAVLCHVPKHEIVNLGTYFSYQWCSLLFCLNHPFLLSSFSLFLPFTLFSFEPFFPPLLFLPSCLPPFRLSSAQVNVSASLRFPSDKQPSGGRVGVAGGWGRLVLLRHCSDSVFFQQHPINIETGRGR